MPNDCGKNRKPQSFVLNRMEILCYIPASNYRKINVEFVPCTDHHRENWQLPFEDALDLTYKPAFTVNKSLDL